MDKWRLFHMWANNQRGIGLIIAVVTMLIFSVILVVVVSLVSSDSEIVFQQLRSNDGGFIARSGFEKASYQFKNGTACDDPALDETDKSFGSGKYTTTATLYPIGPTTTLSAGIGAVDTTIPVALTANYASHGRITLDSEAIDYTGKTATSFTGAKRGANSTTAAAHSSGASVGQNECLINTKGWVGTSTDTVGYSQRVVEAAYTIPVGGGNQVQTNTLTFSTPTTTVGSPQFNPVDPTKSFLIFQIRPPSSGGGYKFPQAQEIRGRINAAGTQLDFVQEGDEAEGPWTIEVRWYVVEYNSGVKVQRGETVMGSATVNQSLSVSPYTPVASLNQAFVIYSKTPEFSAAQLSDDDVILAELSTISNIRFRAQNIVASEPDVIWWQVVEFTDASKINVQKNTGSMAASAASFTGTLTTPVDRTKTFVLVGFTVGGGDAIGKMTLRAQLYNSGSPCDTEATCNQVYIDRGFTGNPGGAIAELFWQAVELKDGSTVYNGSEPFTIGSSRHANVPIGGSVDPARSIAFASAQGYGSQGTGRTPRTDDDSIGVTSFTMALTNCSPNCTQVDMQRSVTLDPADVGWFVVQFPSGSGGGSFSQIDWREVY